jgi:translation initiation factor IF-3
VIGANNEQLGVLPISQAISAAKAQKLDLVEISSASVPPVCKIVNFGKFRYEQEKKEKAAKKKQKIVVLKEIKIRPKIDIHDLKTKKNHIEKFLKEGNKVKVTIMFRGREMAHKEIGKAILDKIVVEFTPLSDVEQQSKLEGYNMSTVLAPKKGK